MWHARRGHRRCSGPIRTKGLRIYLGMAGMVVMMVRMMVGVRRSKGGFRGCRRLHGEVLCC